jgi:nucleotide-binding universal stress UspA family protein
MVNIEEIVVLLGSVSHGVIQHADRPVIIVPSAEVATARIDQQRI